MAFIESPRFPDDISYGSSGGPKWNTSVIIMNSGYEKRNQNWADARHEYDVAYAVKTTAQLQSLIDHFNMVKGMANAFRYKDWADYQVTNEIFTLTGAPTTQLIKTYGSTPNTWVRDITKPVVTTITFESSSAEAKSYSFVASTGVVTLDVISSSPAATLISKASTASVHFGTSHNRSVGDIVVFSSVGGMTEIEGAVATVASVVTATNYLINVDSTGYTTFINDGNARANMYPQPGDDITWSGEFDVPVRFDSDRLSAVLDDFDIGNADVSLVEVRI